MLIDIVLIYAVGRGGLENVITKVANGLIKRGHRVRVFQAYKPEFSEWADTLNEIYYYAEDVPFENINTVGYEYAKKYRKAIEEKGRPDIVIATQSTNLSYICNVALNDGTIRKVPQLSWLHGPVSAYGRRELLSFSNAHMALSNKLREDLSLWLNKESIYVVGNPVDMKNVEVINRSKDRLDIVCLGRLSPEKDIETLFAALSKINGNWQLKIVGDGGHTIPLVEMAKRLNINDKIQWLGWQAKPWSVINEASVTVISSLYEGFSMTTAESLARGIPVISTACGGPQDMVTDGVNGWIYPIKDSERLGEILQSIMDKRISLPEKEVCRKSIEKFSEEKVISNIEEAIIKTYYKFYGFL